MRNERHPSFNDKWPEQITKFGHTQVPNLLRWGKKILKVTDSEFLVLEELISHKWGENKPYPGVKRIGARIGQSTNTVRRNLRNLEKKNLIKRVPRVGQTNEYDLSPLVNKLQEVSSHPEIKGLLFKKEEPPEAITDNPPSPYLNTKEDAIELDPLKDLEKNSLSRVDLADSLRKIEQSNADLADKMFAFYKNRGQL